MNPIQRQIELQRELGGLGARTVQQIAELNQATATRYSEMNREFATRRPAPGDLSGWAQLQREYGEALCAGARENMAQQGEVWRLAFEQSGALVRTAFAFDEPSSERQ